jgi:hypothetical protein
MIGVVRGQWVSAWNRKRFSMLVDEIVKQATSMGLSHVELRNGASPYSGGALLIGTKEACSAATNPSSGIRLDAETRGMATTSDPATTYKGRVGHLTVVVVRANPDGKYVAGTMEEIKSSCGHGIPLSSNSDGEYTLVPVELRMDRLSKMKENVFGGFDFGNVSGFNAIENLVRDAR